MHNETRYRSKRILYENPRRMKTSMKGFICFSNSFCQNNIKTTISKEKNCMKKEQNVYETKSLKKIVT